MIDFTNLPVRNKTYAGANGSKISVLYNDELYMLKFPFLIKNYVSVSVPRVRNVIREKQTNTSIEPMGSFA